MNNKVYTLKELPPKAFRPAPIKFSRWLAFLSLLALLGVMLTRLSGKYIEPANFWFIAACSVLGAWLAIFIPYYLMWLSIHIVANGKDKARQEWILTRTRESRRALQVLCSQFRTCHQQGLVHSTPLKALMDNRDVIESQSDRRGNRSVRHSQLPSKNTDTIINIASATLIELLSPIIDAIRLLPSLTPVKILLEVSGSITVIEVKAIVEKYFSDCDVNNSVEFVFGSGFLFIDSWLESNIKDTAVFLAIALQIDPNEPNESAEAVTAILFGNRLTQTTLAPMAILHRPDPASGDELAAGMEQAADNVPLKDNIIEHLWLSNLTPVHYQNILKNMTQYPADSVKPENIITPDTTIGHAGVVSPWLALAAAACAAQQNQAPQMLITGDRSKDILWSALLMPVFLQQEKDS